MSAKRPHDDVQSVKELLARSDTNDERWLIKGLIREGDQVVLAGPPKSGKSYLAIQLAMAVAEGVNHAGQAYFLQPEFELSGATTRRKVLFFSLEMGSGVIRTRLRHWLNLKRPVPDEAPITLMENLKFVFSVRGQSTLNLGDAKCKIFRAVRGLITLERPELIIFDTFVRVHSEDENDNVNMAALMQNLHDLCRIGDALGQNRGQKITHVIVHHLRKPGPKGRHGSGVIDAVRGAGSIIGAADLILGMDVAGDRNRSLEFCSRHVPPLDDLTLEPLDASGRVAVQTKPSKDIWIRSAWWTSGWGGGKARLVVLSETR